MTTDSCQEAEHPETKSEGRFKTLPFREASIFIILISGLIYLPVIHGTLIWDDKEILLGRGIGSPHSILQCFVRPFLYHYYRPLTSASFFIDRWIWDTNTFGYHLTSILLHVLTTAVLIAVISAAFPKRPVVALLGALMFAMQPVQVSTVAWIGGRTDCLSTFWIAVFFWTVITAARSEGIRRNRLLALSVMCFALAALSKEQALAIAPLGPLGLVVFGAARPKRSELIAVIGFYIAAGIGLMAAWARFGNPVHPHWNLLQQLPVIGRTIDYYLLVLLAPTPQLIHSLTLDMFDRVRVAADLFGFLLAVGVVWLFVRWMRTAPEAAWFLAAAVMLFIPVSNLYPLVTQTVAPYRAGTIGLPTAVVVAWALAGLVELLAKGRWGSGDSHFTSSDNSAQAEGTVLRGKPAIAVSCIALYVVGLAGLTCWGVPKWNNELIASLTTEKYNPAMYYGILQTASAMLDRGRVEPALARIDAVAYSMAGKGTTFARPSNALPWMARGYLPDWVGELYGVAGTIRLNHGDRASAIELLNKGISYSPQNVIVNTGLANYYLSAHDLVNAEKPIRTVLKMQPSEINQRIVLGRILMAQNRWKEASDQFIICIQQQPDVPDTYIFAAFVQIQYGNLEAARQTLNAGLERNVLNPQRVQSWLSLNHQPDLLK